MHSKHGSNDSMDVSDARRFWQRELADAPFAALPRWPAEFRFHTRGTRTRVIRVPDRDVERLMAVAAGHGVSPRHLLVAVHVHVMRMVTGEGDLVTGLVPGLVTELDHPRHAMPLRCRERTRSWIELARQACAAEERLAAHDRVPPAEIRGWLDAAPLFEVSIDVSGDVSGDVTELAAAHGHELAGGHGHAEPWPGAGHGHARPDDICLAVCFARQAGTGALCLVLRYDQRELAAEQVGELAAYYGRALEALVAAPLSAPRRAPLLSNEDIAELVALGRSRSLAPPRCIHERVLEQAQKTPLAVALRCGAEIWTYAALARQARAIARALQARGYGPGLRVAVYMERSPMLVATLVAIVQSGSAYVPLDPMAPPERTALMLEDSGACAVVTSAALAQAVPASWAELLYIEELAATPARELHELQPPHSHGSMAARDPRATAYVLYTAGSTGRPRGIAVAHASVDALIQWAHDTFSAEELSGVLASTSICFDLSVFEMFVPLSVGGAVIMSRDLLELPGLAGRDQVTLINTVPSLLGELLCTADLPTGVTTINLAGEALLPELMAALRDQPGLRRVLNLYGPSEATVYAIWHEVDLASTEPPPIGRPIHGTRAYVLDAELGLCPPGVPGELFVGGAGVVAFDQGEVTFARGAQGGTHVRVIPDPFADVPGQRLYRTGDRARLLPGGELAFVGREHGQVTIRGRRVDLDQLSAVLGRCGLLREAEVVVRGQGHDACIVAYLVWRAPATADLAEVRRFLGARLPAFMMPMEYVALPALPRTLSGKVDRKRLVSMAQPCAATAVRLRRLASRSWPHAARRYPASRR